MRHKSNGRSDWLKTTWAAMITWWKKQWKAYEAGYRDYLSRRGFSSCMEGLPFAHRAFIAPWKEPGFHRFWQVWNPGISYFAFRMYLFLGGSKARDRSTIVAFLASGIAHNVVALPFTLRWSFTLPVAFLCFGIMTVITRRLNSVVDMERWPTLLHVAINIAGVILGFNVGFMIESFFYCG